LTGGRGLEEGRREILERRLGPLAARRLGRRRRRRRRGRHLRDRAQEVGNAIGLGARDLGRSDDAIALDTVALLDQLLSRLRPGVVLAGGDRRLRQMVRELHDPIVAPLLHHERDQQRLGTGVPRVLHQRLAQALLGLLLQAVLGEDLGLRDQVLVARDDRRVHLRRGALEQVGVDAHDRSAAPPRREAFLRRSSTRSPAAARDPAALPLGAEAAERSDRRRRRRFRVGGPAAIVEIEIEVELEGLRLRRVRRHAVRRPRRRELPAALTEVETGGAGG
jgi:hypothetical protein